jgi:hypothetical protein
VFRLEPLGPSGGYLIHRVAPGPGGDERCLGVRAGPDAASTLVSSDCNTYRQMVFEIVASGRTDDKGRPTYVISNRHYGTVQFSTTKRLVFLGPATDGTTVSFVDRGAA